MHFDDQGAVCLSSKKGFNASRSEAPRFPLSHWERADGPHHLSLLKGAPAG